MSSENNLDFFVTDHLNNEQLNSTSQLYIKHLSDNGFLALFGKKFILELFRDILEKKSGFFVLATHKKEVCGFALCSVNSELLFEIIYKNFFKYFIIILPQVIAKPKLIPKLIETFFYVKKQNSDIKAEFVAAAIDPDYRSMGRDLN